MENVYEGFSMKDRLICALDVSNKKDAIRIVKELDGVVSFFKVGIVLQLVAGTDLIKWLIENGKRVFLDLKYYDVPRTVEEAVSQVAKLGVSFLTIHGNGEIIKEAVRGRGKSGLKLLSVTVLTSLDNHDLQDLGLQCAVQDLVLLRARKALEYGCDGVISSPAEVGLIKEKISPNLLVVTPGIRPKDTWVNDHKRFATPGKAIKEGADYIVVGRPIINNPNGLSPREAALQIIEEMESASFAATK